MSEGANTSKRRTDRAALVVAIGMFALAAVVAWDASKLGGAASYARIGPQTVPYVIAGCLAALGIWTVIEALRGDFPEREHQEYSPVLWIIGGLLAQIVLLKTAGFSIATGVMFGLVASGLGKKPLWLSIPIGIVLALVVYLIFARGLALHLPPGPIETALDSIGRGAPA
jgi:putative tricarboxylic transport membrane protein